MNPNYNKTITLYNCLKAVDNPEKKDIWHRHVLRDCFYKNVIARVEKANGVQMTNAYTVRVPESSKYRPYSEWVKLSEDERKSFFTFHTDDIVVKGECTEEIGSTATSSAAQVLNRMKPDAFRITAFSDNTSHDESKHYRIGG